MSTEPPVGMSFKVDLAANGDVQRVYVLKDGASISLTPEQARQFMGELARRFVLKGAQNLSEGLLGHLEKLLE